jgi:hypothetical protein
LLKEIEKCDKAILEGGKSKFKTYNGKSSRTGEVFNKRNLFSTV